MTVRLNIKLWSTIDGVCPNRSTFSLIHTIVTVEIIGTGTGCKHGGFWNCHDRYNPGTLLKHKWENAMTIDKHSWGYRRDAKLEDYLTTHELLTTLSQTIRYFINHIMA